MPHGTDRVDGRCSALGAALRPRASRLGLRRAAIAARAARPEPVTRGERPQRPAISNSDRHAPESSTTQGDEHRSKVTAGRRGDSKDGTCRVWGEVHSPSPGTEWLRSPGTRQERLRRPPDRAKPARPLTEPVPPGFWRLSGEGGGVVSGHRGQRGRCPAVQQRNTAAHARNGYRD